MVSLVAAAIGIVLAVLYVGFFAYEIGSVALWVLTLLCLGAMVYALQQDTRGELDARDAQRRRERAG